MAEISDQGEQVIFTGKSIRMVGGGAFFSHTPTLFSHFEEGAGAINSWVPQKFVTTETGAATPFALGATGASVLIAVTGGTTNNGEELAGKRVSWVPSTSGILGKLSLEVRAKFVGATTATDGDFYLGFADAVTFTNSLPYVISAASAFTTSVPTEFAGFGYSSIPTSGTLYSASGNYIGIVTEKAASAAAVLSTGVVKDSLFHVYRVELDSSGNATFFLDDAKVGVTLLAVTAATALTPYIVANAKNTHAHTATIDYIHVKGDLV